MKLSHHLFRCVANIPMCKKVDEGTGNEHWRACCPSVERPQNDGIRTSSGLLNSSTSIIGFAAVVVELLATENTFHMQSSYAEFGSKIMAIGQYQYQSLKDDGAIRILTLDPAKHCEPLRGSLEAVPISSAGSYEALSYVWGQPGPADIAYEILIRNGGSGGDEAILALRGGSIVAALRHLRLPDRPRRIWADQCCINQDDMVERSEQVRLMNRIYRDATQVLVWLGLDTERRQRRLSVSFASLMTSSGALPCRT